MSYVIQNFNQLPRSVVITPRFKYLVILNNTDLVGLFFKITSFILLNKSFQSLNFFSFSSIYKFFFLKQHFDIYKMLSLKSYSGYLNNVANGSIYYSLLKFEENLRNRHSCVKQLKYENTFFYNLYYLSIKTGNTPLNKFYYKNIIFTLILFVPHFWYQHTSYFKFYLNFFFIVYNLQLYSFYNGFFFKIYNF